jgi:hypothetical protein
VSPVSPDSIASPESAASAEASADPAPAPATAPADAASWDQRRLCPDELCIGVLNNLGVCKVCGKLGEPGAPGSDVDSAAADSDDDYGADDDDDNADLEGPDSDNDDDSDDDADLLGSPSGSAASPTFADDLEQRALCPNELCIGVIDDNGRCKVCGTRFP